jgi:hypothetical protein
VVLDDVVPGWALVAHICNPSYSGGRDQEDGGSKPAQATSSQDPISKKASTKKGWWSGLRCRTCIQHSNPSTMNQKKEKKDSVRAGWKKELTLIFPHCHSQPDPFVNSKPEICVSF